METVRLDSAEGMDRAELKYVKLQNSPRAVLVLCPGYNGTPDVFLSDPEWVNFARKNDLGLAGLSFASPLSKLHDGSGYYYASKGSGEKLLTAIRQVYGKDLPLLLFGISGGAHFTSRFQQWKPKQVLGWCAYSAGWWDQPKPDASGSPGIVACGDEDERYGASIVYFKQGRAVGAPWLWISLPKTGHTRSVELERFVREYFETLLQADNHSPVWLDIDRKEIILSEKNLPAALTGWLPTKSLFDHWYALHSP